MGFKNLLGSRVQVRVDFESPVLFPYPSPGFGGYIDIDIHHDDSVELAFYHLNHVMT
jgi:hypothetical protein